MGKMNFIAGGYYGKLGQTVGQRWRNRRNVRAYVIPKNPKTEAQESNRETFADCTGAAQLAIQMNSGSRLWNETKNTAFNLRVSESRKYAENGGDFWTYIPVVPYAYLPKYSFEATPSKSGRVLSWTCTTNDDISGRIMAIAIQFWNTSTQKNVRHVFRTTISGSAGAWIVRVTIPTGYALSGESWQCGINCDDNDTDLDSIYLPAQSLEDFGEIFTVTPQSISLTWNATAGTYTGVITLDRALETSATPLLTATLSGVLLGEITEQSSIIQTVNSSGALVFSFTPVKDSLNQRLLFPSGSSCTIAAGSFQGVNYTYIVPNTTLSVSAATQRQTWPVIGLSAVRNADNTITVDTGISGVTSASTNCVVNIISYTSSLSEEADEIALPVVSVSNTLSFTTSAAVADWVNANAQTQTLATLPYFVKNGVEYWLNDDETVTLPAGLSSFSVAISAATVAFDSSTGKQTFTFTVDKTLPAALSVAASVVYNGVQQLENVSETVSTTLQASYATLTATPALAKDSYSQVQHFPSGSSVVVPNAIATVSGYTFNFSGGTFSVTESNIPALVYAAAFTQDSSFDYPFFYTVAISGISNFTSGRVYALSCLEGEEETTTFNWDENGTVYLNSTNHICLDFQIAYELLRMNGKPTLRVDTIPTFVKNGITWKLFESTGIQELNATNTYTTTHTLEFTGQLTDGILNCFYHYPTISGLPTAEYPVTYTGGTVPSQCYIQIDYQGTKYYASATVWTITEFFDETGEYVQLSLEIHDSTFLSLITEGAFLYITNLDYKITPTLKDSNGTQWSNAAIDFTHALVYVSEVE